MWFVNSVESTRICGWLYHLWSFEPDSDQVLASFSAGQLRSTITFQRFPNYCPPSLPVSMADERALSNLRKRRAVVRSSITRLSSRLKTFEDAPDGPGTGDHAKQLATKLDNLDAEFKSLHLQLIDQISADEIGELEREQETLDKHDDDIATLTVH